MKVPWQAWMWLFASIICYTTGEYFSKKIAEKFSYNYVLLIGLCYGAAGLAWIPAIMKTNTLIILGFIWSILSIVSTLSIGFLMGETLTITQSIGVCLGVAGLLLMSY